MIIDPVTLKLSKHELQAVAHLVEKALTAGMLGTRSNAGTFEHALDRMLGALKKHEADKQERIEFEAFWAENQHLLLGEARAAFRATKGASHG